MEEKIVLIILVMFLLGIILGFIGAGEPVLSLHF